MFRRILKRNTTSRHAAITTSRSGLLSRLAGIPVGMRQTRRGSFLIMVVGTLALLSVITVIYVSIGRGDSQTSVAAQKFDERDDVPEQVRDYIAGIIAADLFDTLYLGERDEDGNPIFRREAWDYPSTAYSTIVPVGPADVSGQIVVGGPVPPRFHFTPTGNGTGTDPWLASSEPSLQNFDATGLSGETMPDDYYLERLDWMNLSNAAPDGSFVNLYNLRGAIVNGVSRGNFDATPWEMRGYNLDSNSSNATLTLFEDTPDSPPGNRNLNRDFGGTATLSSAMDALPADTTSRQRWAVYPKVEPRLDPDNANYLLYQYADADGDGILDSRWFEMAEDRDPNDLIETQLLVHDDRLRFFIATRIIDLSGRVNVNTATDSTLAPFADDPYGLNPGAIDIRRLLTLEDFATDTRTIVGYSDHLQPNYPGNPLAEDPENYEDYDTANADNNNYYTGEKAYDALRMVLDTGMMPERGYAGLDLLAGGTGVPTDIDREFSLAAGGDALNPYWDTYWKRTPPNDFLAPSNYYSLFAGFGSGGGAGYAPGGGDISSGLGRSFGIDSLFELLAFNGANNDTIRSPLEVALSGRADPAAIAPELAARFGPLRDNRSLDLERTRGQWPAGPGSYNFFDEAKAALYTDARQRITPLSGNRPITPSRIPANPSNSDQPNPADLPLDTSDTKKNIKDMLDAGQPQDIFKAYVDALLPYSVIDSHWSDPMPRQSDTLYYGYRGPELAIRTAAHMAVNLQDAYDDENSKSPTTRSVVLVSGMPGLGNPEFRLDDELLAPNAGDVYAPTVTVFGIEAQPFIVEAATYVMYTDAPVGAGGDTDWLDLGGGIADPNTLPTIDGTISSSNPDFLFQCIAFKIHNPFTFDLDLTNDAGQHYIQYGNYYYRLYDDDASGPITLDARDDMSISNGNTVIAYYVNPSPADIAQRWADVTGKTQAEELIRFNDWLQRQLSGDPLIPNNIEFVRVRAYEDNAFASEVLDIRSDLLDSPPGDDGVVQLFRNDPSLTPSAVLVDRMRDPNADGSFDRRLTGGNNDVTGTTGGFEGENDNDGLTYTRHADIRRRQDPQASMSTNPPLGSLPGYCLESKSQTPTLANIEDLDGASSSGLDIGDFVSPEGGDTADGVIGVQASTGDLIPSMRNIPEEQDGGPPSNQIGANLAGLSFDGVLGGTEPLYVEPHLNNDEFETADGVSTMRIADILLPLGIGPHFSTQEGWTTLSEALAMALAYDEPGDTDPLSIYANMFYDPAPTFEPLLDRGFIRYDAFVPFFDALANGMPFDPTTDTRWGLGVPAAATLFDTFTTLPPKFGSITTPTHGQINVNTASREVLRSLPGLSPPLDTNPDGSPNWWWTDPTHNSNSDIATTLKGYRDRLSIFPRDIIGTEIVNTLNFRDSWQLDFSARDLRPTGVAPGSHEAELLNENSRWGNTGVMGIREGLGIRSLGEIALIRDFGYSTSNLGYDFPHDIDRLGFDQDPAGNPIHVNQPGIDSIVYGTTADDDQIANDYDERLALVNTVMASSSIRSDVFAVWFIVHGYQESDVKGLGDNDPLVPSVARRFVMVVDRSNVTEPGQKPEILLFKEVPL